MPANQWEQVQNVLRRAGWHFEPASADSVKGLCPSPDHAERTPSCYVYSDLHAHCYGCQGHWSLTKFIEFLIAPGEVDGSQKAQEFVAIHGHGTSFVPSAPKVREYLKSYERAALGTCLCIYRETFWSKDGLPAQEYLAQRFPKDIEAVFRLAREWGIGYALDGHLDEIRRKLGHFPDYLTWLQRAGVVYFDEEQGWIHRLNNRLILPETRPGEGPVYYQGRDLGGHAKNKYLSPPSPKRLMGVGDCQKESRNVVGLVEGPLDLLAIRLAGWGGIASLGSGTREKIEEYVRDRDIIMAFDNDEAGQRMGKRLITKGARSVRVLLLPQGLDPADFVRREGAKHLKDLLT